MLKQDHEFRTLLNFRDIGSAQTTGGKRVPGGMIYRSANPDKISASDIKKLHALDIRTIIDLRAPYESRKKKRLISGIETISLPLDFEKTTRERLMPLLYKKDAFDEIDEINCSLYLAILDAAIPVFRQVAETLQSAERRPVLIHCQAGKDRTGVICALLQLALGADRQSIIGDYMRSNESLMPYFRKRLMLRKILSLGFFPSATILYTIRVKEKNIVSVLDRVNDHYGGIEAYANPSGSPALNLRDLREQFVSPPELSELKL
ncbi:MAG: tyrosine-protein phosphatase [Bacteroidales bacterium]|nr:tyrosine-protein phosphatase [Bacteroidales bacterium]